MKQSGFKKLIKEAVREVIQEELKDILLEAVRVPRPQPVVEQVQQPTMPLPKSPSMNYQDKREAYKNILGDMQASFGTQHVPQPLQLTGNIDTASPQGKLPEGNVSMDQIMGLMNSK
tara:strand:- start:336 stop:686 length:351 start_codon:yes stop_codon:yes gene_type:complete